MVARAPHGVRGSGRRRRGHVVERGDDLRGEHALLDRERALELGGGPGPEDRRGDADPVADPATTTPDGTTTISVTVTNTGGREADEVVQLYLHQRHGTASRPVRELKGFQRVTLAAGEERTVSFAVGPAERRYWNAAVRDWVTDASTFDVLVGGSSAATAATTFEVSPR